MSPKPHTNIKHQQGFLIPLALFILVGMLALALSASRLTAQSGTSATLEGLSTQAFYAAESGGQYGMYRLFGAVDTTATMEAQRTTATANCAALNAGPTPDLDFAVAGLSVCRAEISCEHELIDANVDGNTDAAFFRIQSAGSCGSGELSAQRVIEVSAAI